VTETKAYAPEQRAPAWQPVAWQPVAGNSDVWKDSPKAGSESAL